MKTETRNKKTRNKEGFNSVEFFREIKRKLAERMTNMTLEEQKDFLKKVREGKITIA